MSIKTLILPTVVAAALVGCSYAATTNTTTTATNPYATTTASTSAASTDNYGYGSSTTPAASATTTTSTSISTSGSVVTTMTSSTAGSYLADGSGKTLYTYNQDKSGVSNCGSSCIASWPVYAATNAPASLPANVTVITRSDGSQQFAYKGLPLYYFVSDTQAGMVTGNGVGGFKVVTP